jgi:hypothetical protein
MTSYGLQPVMRLALPRSSRVSLRCAILYCARLEDVLQLHANTAEDLGSHARFGQPPRLEFLLAVTASVDGGSCRTIGI